MRDSREGGGESERERVCVRDRLRVSRKKVSEREAERV